MKLAIASGKGGTGKTTLAVNLALAADRPVRLADCDVEEPNDHLFFPAPKWSEQVIDWPLPQVDEALCDGCGECSDFCEYNAIVTFGTVPYISPDLCHGCGGCQLVCPQKAITETSRRIGVVKTAETEHVSLIEGRSDIGTVLTTPLIRAVKNQAAGAELIILDAPPGTSCPVITTLQGSDFVVLVTEPTPFGLNDLELAVGAVRELGLPFGVVINRAGSGDDRVLDWCRNNHITVLAEIAEDRRIAESYSRGEALVTALPEYRDLFAEILEKVGA